MSTSTTEKLLNDFIRAEKLPSAYRQTVASYFEPLADELLTAVQAHHGSFILGISGSQGSGKSTLAALLVLLLQEKGGLRCINLSLDDFYFGLADREALAARVHPLLRTRGVPGTHDVDLALSTLDSLQQAGAVAIPRFDKARDDRQISDQWPRVEAPVDLIVLEGWCLGLLPQPDAALAEPVNELEAKEDADGRWRHYINQQLGSAYQKLFARLDYLLMLQAPGFESVYRWRQLQEDKLAGKTSVGKESRLMNPEQLRRFIQHYERLTRHALSSLPELADSTLLLNEQQQITGRRNGAVTRKK